MTAALSGRALVVATVLTLAGCAPDGPDAYTAPPTDSLVASASANGETVQVRSLDNSFRPETVEIVAGTEILWTNNGRNDHDVLPVDDALTWGVETEDFVPGDEYRLVFDTPGVFPYYCSIHGTKEVGMVGTVIVTAPDA